MPDTVSIPLKAATGSPLTRKLAEIMATVDRVPKRGKNAFHGYQYATEADVSDTVRNELSKRQVVIYSAIDALETRVDVGDGGKSSNYVTATMTFTLVDGESGEERSFKWAGAGQDRGEKGLYKAITGAEKYFLLKLFLIPTGDDPEDDHGDVRRAPAPARAVTPALPPPASVPAPTAPPAHDASAINAYALPWVASGSPISEKQRGRLFAIAKRHGWPEAEIKQHVQLCGYEHSADILTAHYEAIVAFFDRAYDGMVA
jgi:hypothetical protein